MPLSSFDSRGHHASEKELEGYQVVEPGFDARSSRTNRDCGSEVSMDCFPAWGVLLPLLLSGFHHSFRVLFLPSPPGHLLNQWGHFCLQVIESSIPNRFKKKMDVFDSSNPQKRRQSYFREGWIQRSTNVNSIFLLSKFWLCVLFWRLNFQAPHGIKRAQQFQFLHSYKFLEKQKEWVFLLRSSGLVLELRHVASDRSDRGQGAHSCPGVWSPWINLD